MILLKEFKIPEVLHCGHVRRVKIQIRRHNYTKGGERIHSSSHLFKKM